MSMAKSSFLNDLTDSLGFDANRLKCAKFTEFLICF